ncbi:MAG: SHOCT domain-containing protein [Nocardioidaceae bacterium]
MRRLLVVPLSLIPVGLLAAPASADEFTDPMNDGGGGGGAFAAIFLLFAMIGVGIFVARITLTRKVAEDAGLDPDRATQVELLGSDGLEATYLAASLTAHPPTAAPQPPADERPAADRLRELSGLLEQGLITQEEHDARRRRIIDDV